MKIDFKSNLEKLTWYYHIRFQKKFKINWKKVLKMHKNSEKNDNYIINKKITNMSFIDIKNKRYALMI